MTAGPPVQTDSAPPPGVSELESGRKKLAFARLLGKISACVFLIAVLAVIDGLQTLMRQEFNAVSLCPGESATISGMMPLDTASHTDLAVELDNLSGLVFRPIESFKGFWMGGRMWRASLTASASASPGKGTLTVVDMVPLKKVGQTTVPEEKGVPQPAPANASSATVMGQNPALVYSVTVWPSAAERDAAVFSFLSRHTGQPPFVVAGAATALALLLGLGNFLLFSRAEKRLAHQGVYFIHGIKKKDDGLHASFAHAGQDAFMPGDPVLLYDANWREHGQGAIADKDPVKGFALFAPETPPRYGWLVALVKEERDTPARGGPRAGAGARVPENRASGPNASSSKASGPKDPTPKISDPKAPDKTQ